MIIIHDQSMANENRLTTSLTSNVILMGTERRSKENNQWCI